MMLEEMLAKHGFAMVEKAPVFVKVRHAALPNEVQVLAMAYGREPSEADVTYLADRTRRRAYRMARGNAF